MVRSTGTNIANGIFSGITLACGIIFSVLVGVMFKKVLGMATLGTSNIDAYAAYASSPLWSIGFGYIIPGLIGVIASLAQQKGGFIAQMVFCIIALLVMGIFFIIAIIALVAVSAFSAQSCYTIGNTCSCLNGLRSSLTAGYTCEDINSISSMSIGAVSMIVLGWIFCLIACITSGILACERENTGHVVYQPPIPMQPAVTVVHSGGVQPHVGYAAQPGYGVQPGYASPPAQPGYGHQPYYPSDSVKQQY